MRTRMKKTMTGILGVCDDPRYLLPMERRSYVRIGSDHQYSASTSRDTHIHYFKSERMSCIVALIRLQRCHLRLRDIKYDPQ